MSQVIRRFDTGLKMADKKTSRTIDVKLNDAVGLKEAAANVKSGKWKEINLPKKEGVPTPSAPKVVDNVTTSTPPAAATNTPSVPPPPTSSAPAAAKSKPKGTKKGGSKKASKPKGTKKGNGKKPS